MGETSGRSRRRGEQTEERHKARESRAETWDTEEEEGKEEEGGSDGETPRGAPVEVIRVGGEVPPLEENANLLVFTPERANMLLQGVYGDFPHHNYGSHLEGGVADNAIWQRHWRRLAAQSASWYATPYEAVGRRFTAILDLECRRVLDRSWNSEIPLVFAHVVLTKKLGVHRAQENRARITRRMYLWDRGIHTGMVGDAKVEGATQEGRAASGGEEGEEAISQSYPDTMFLVSFGRPSTRQPTGRGEGVFSQMTNVPKPGDRFAEVLREKQPDMCVPPRGKSCVCSLRGI